MEEPSEINQSSQSRKIIAVFFAQIKKWIKILKEKWHKIPTAEWIKILKEKWHKIPTAEWIKILKEKWNRIAQESKAKWRILASVVLVVSIVLLIVLPDASSDEQEESKIFETTQQMVLEQQKKEAYLEASKIWEEFLSHFPQTHYREQIEEDIKLFQKISTMTAANQTAQTTTNQTTQAVADSTVQIVATQATQATQTTTNQATQAVVDLTTQAAENQTTQPVENQSTQDNIPPTNNQQPGENLQQTTAEVSPYHLPMEVWNSCKYEYNGEVMLDMTTEYWCRLSPSQQSQYAGQYQAGYAAAKNLALEKTIHLPNLPTSAKQMILRLIPPGRFWMGSPEDEPGRNIQWQSLSLSNPAATQEEIKSMLLKEVGSDMGEGPRHRVVVSSPFYLAQYECTQAQWQAVMGNNPSHFSHIGQDAPVEQVTWNSIANGDQSFCNRAGLTLPSEFQWEYACRAGTIGMTYIGDFEIKGPTNAPRVSDLAWYAGNSEYEGATNPSNTWDEKATRGTHLVGQKLPNGFGLYDVLGNVGELCIDNPRQYKSLDEHTPIGRQNPLESLVSRGYSWCSTASTIRSACRNFTSPSNAYIDIGFRPVSSIR